MFFKKGFSLIELLVSISIISILVSAALFILKPMDYIKRSRDSRRQSDLKVIQTALEQYYANKGDYPATADAPLDGTSWMDGSVTYLRSVPKDPNGGGNYCYQNSSPNYLLCANVETFSGTSGICNGVTYNYCLSNPF